MNKHLELSSFICSKDECKKRIKKSIIERKHPNNIVFCFKHFKEFQSEKRNHQMREAKEIKNNPLLRAQKRKHLPLRTN